MNPMRGISNAQQSTVIGVTARIPVVEARKMFLERLEQQLPSRGEVSDEQLLQAVDAALKSFRPGTWYGDEQGPIPNDTTGMALSEFARSTGAACRCRCGTGRHTRVCPRAPTASA
jgi:hypothetical protein